MTKKLFYFLVLVLLVLNGCITVREEPSSNEVTGNSVVCNYPYIYFESGCCLDSNSNRICDEDEVGRSVRPGRLTNSCTIMPGVSCEDFVVKKESNSIILNLRNGIGYSLRDVSVAIIDKDSSNLLCELICIDGCTMNDNMPDEELTTWANTNCFGEGETDIEGTRFNGDIAISYIDNKGLSHTRFGSITTQVEN